jgi:hypothetical protein
MGSTTKESGFDSQQEKDIFLFFTVSRLALGPNQPPIQWVPGTLSLGIKQQLLEAKDKHVVLSVNMVISLWVT